jgi:glycosyltransferase involved in cell wall biosynthesis
VRLSVITAVKADRSDHLLALYESLKRQALPPGWDWRWVLQEDGETGEPLAMLPDDPRISAGMAPWGRAPRARTVALSRVDGKLVRAVDADDVLPEGALYRDIEALSAHPEMGWCVSPAVDLLEDGSTRPGPRDPEPGPLPPRFLERGERAGLIPVLGGTMCAHTELIQALGGWPALWSEDVGLLLAAEAVAPGWMLGEPGLLYRRWHKAAGSAKDKQSASPPTPAREVMVARVQALRASGWRWAPRVPVAPVPDGATR